MRYAAAQFISCAFALGSAIVGAQEPLPDVGSEAEENLRATLLGTTIGRPLTIALRSGETVEGELAEVGGDSFEVWVTPDEETRSRLGLTGGRVKRTIRFEEVENIPGVAIVARSADRLAYRMGLGDTVYVLTAAGDTFKGTVDDFDGDVLRLGGRTMSLSGAQGETIDQIDLRVDDSLKNGVLIGAGIGVSLAALACISLGGCGADEGAVIAAFYAGAGSGLGALFDALSHRRQLIYVAPPSTPAPRVRLLPVLTRDRKGLLISVGF